MVQATAKRRLAVAQAAIEEGEDLDMDDDEDEDEDESRVRKASDKDHGSTMATLARCLEAAMNESVHYPSLFACVIIVGFQLFLTFDDPHEKHQQKKLERSVSRYGKRLNGLEMNGKSAD
ncbi:hypothetical protein BGZ65_009892, partial [Modicella reniformis]